MKIQKFFTGALIVSISFLIFPCIGNGVTKHTLKAPAVTMITCLPSFAGSESISLTPEFTISNPNDFFIGVSMDYKLEAENQLVGTSLIPTIYVPPNGKIEVRDTVVMPFMAWFASELVSGKSKKDAVGVVAPLWKGLGAQRPAALPEDLWDKIPSKKPAMTARGSIVVVTETGQEIFHFTSKWQD